MPCLSGNSIGPAHKRSQRVHTRGGNTTYTHTLLINESSATLTNWPHPGITQWASSWGRPKRWHVKGGTRQPILWTVSSVLAHAQYRQMAQCCFAGQYNNSQVSYSNHATRQQIAWVQNNINIYIRQMTQCQRSPSALQTKPISAWKFLLRGTFTEAYGSFFLTAAKLAPSDNISRMSVERHRKALLQKKIPEKPVSVSSVLL